MSGGSEAQQSLSYCRNIDLSRQASSKIKSWVLLNNVVDA